MEKKRYYAYVTENMVEYFEKMLEERKDKIEFIYSHPCTSENNEPVVCYLLEAEEGVIDPKWELKLEKDLD